MISRYLALTPIISLALLMGCDLSVGSEVVVLQPLLVVETSPDDGATDVPLNRPITVVFNRYLDRESFEYFNALKLRSGGIRGRGYTQYSLSDRSLTFIPTRNMRGGLIYTLELNPETVRSIDGQDPYTPLSLSFQTAEEATVELEPPDSSISYESSVSYEERVFPVLEAACSCHADGAVDPTLEYEALVDQPSSQMTGRYLVLPFAPHESYLMQKILPEYPDRRLVEMPPIWSDRAPLEQVELRLVEQWIATGAGR